MRKVLLFPILAFLVVVNTIVALIDMLVEFLQNTFVGWYDYWLEEWENK